MEARQILNKKYTTEEYIALLDAGQAKLEYYDGEIVSMAGALGAHNRIAMNLTLRLGRNANNCQAHNSDQAVTIPLFNHYLFPDLSFTYRKGEYTTENKRFLSNPSLIIEVLSDATKDNDRGRKFNWYFSLPSVKEYLMVDSLTMDVKSYYRKDDNNWAIQSLWRKDQVLEVFTLGEKLTLDEIYEGVELAG